MNFLCQIRTKTLFRYVLLSVLCAFNFTYLPISPVQAGTVLNLPVPGKMVDLSPAYVPLLIKGLKIHPDNPLALDFIVDTGNSNLSLETRSNLSKETEKLVKYFYAALTLPEKDMWVNLSPFEKNRIIAQSTGQTELGRDMLAQDYLLKQVTASLVYPEKGLGKAFWDRVYQQAGERLGGKVQLPVNTFNKVWIVGDKASVYEHQDTVYVVDTHLKVMLEEDYVALDKNNKSATSPKGTTTSSSGVSQVMRDIILPELEREINQGKNFATLRQMYNALVLAKWYKESVQNALLNQVYTNQSKTSGVDERDKTLNNKIYQQYLKAYKKGVFSLIKEDVSKNSQKALPRKYFSGGLRLLDVTLTRERAMISLPKAIGTFLLALSVATVQGPAPAEAGSGEMMGRYYSWVRQLQPPTTPYSRPTVPVRPLSAAELNSQVNLFNKFYGNKIDFIDVDGISDKMRPVEAGFYLKEGYLQIGPDGKVSLRDYLRAGQEGPFDNVADESREMRWFQTIKGEVPPFDTRLEFENYPGFSLQVGSQQAAEMMRTGDMVLLGGKFFLTIPLTDLLQKKGLVVGKKSWGSLPANKETVAQELSLFKTAYPEEYGMFEVQGLKPGFKVSKLFVERAITEGWFKYVQGELSLRKESELHGLEPFTRVDLYSREIDAVYIERFARSIPIENVPGLVLPFRLASQLVRTGEVFKYPTTVFDNKYYLSGKSPQEVAELIKSGSQQAMISTAWLNKTFTGITLATFLLLQGGVSAAPADDAEARRYISSYSLEDAGGGWNSPDMIRLRGMGARAVPEIIKTLTNRRENIERRKWMGQALLTEPKMATKETAPLILGAIDDFGAQAQTGPEVWVNGYLRGFLSEFMQRVGAVTPQSAAPSSSPSLTFEVPPPAPKPAPKQAQPPLSFEIQQPGAQQSTGREISLAGAREYHSPEYRARSAYKDLPTQVKVVDGQTVRLNFNYQASAPGNVVVQFVFVGDDENRPVSYSNPLRASPGDNSRDVTVRNSRGRMLRRVVIQTGENTHVGTLPGGNYNAVATLNSLEIDNAMNIENQEVQGGIDFDASNIQMRKDGPGVAIKFDPAMLQQFEGGNFQGLLPQVTGFRQINNILPMLGLPVGRQDEKEKLAQI